jgi:hypothetical protein
VDARLPAEARAVLLLHRGYGVERQAGRLLLQKLDYLQVRVWASTAALVQRCRSCVAAVSQG